VSEKITVRRIGAVVVIDDHDKVNTRLRDFFAAAQVRSVACEFDKDGDPIVQITFLDGAHLDWSGISTLDVARAVWPDVAQADLDNSTLLADAERES